MKKKLNTAEILRRKKFIVHHIKVDAGYVPFEVELPADVLEIESVNVTNDVVEGADDCIGLVSLQSNDGGDVFFATDVYRDSIGFDSENPSINRYFADTGIAEIDGWLAADARPDITGRRRKKSLLKLNGETTGKLHGFFKSKYDGYPFNVYLYIECAMAWEQKEAGVEMKMAA